MSHQRRPTRSVTPRTSQSCQSPRIHPRRAVTVAPHEAGQPADGPVRGPRTDSGEAAVEDPAVRRPSTGSGPSCRKASAATSRGSRRFRAADRAGIRRRATDRVCRMVVAQQGCRPSRKLGSFRGERASSTGRPRLLLVPHLAPSPTSRPGLRYRCYIRRGRPLGGGRRGGRGAGRDGQERACDLPRCRAQTRKCRPQ
jgi:hypothetical protein